MSAPRFALHNYRCFPWATMRTLLGSIAAILAFFETSSYGYSTVRQLTKANIEEYSLLIVVKSEHVKDGMVRFGVMVTMPDTTGAASIEGFRGFLTINREQKCVVHCTVASRQTRPNHIENTAAKAGRFVFEFDVSQEYLEFSKFSVTMEYGPEIPARDQYWFYLKDFAITD